jgi:6-pyruvoyltetrahydropterin/6-carboxytetrahydropterin synthase
VDYLITGDKMTYYSTKKYGTDRGLSCCFRQWRATHSHCSTLHGYSIGIKLIFASETLDSRNWVLDFGSLKPFKEWADSMFDHTLIVAADDPQLMVFNALNDVNGGHNDMGICDLRIVEHVGCEAFAKLAYDKMAELLEEFKSGGGRYPAGQDVRLVSAEVFEHDANSAIYEG